MAPRSLTQQPANLSNTPVSAQPHLIQRRTDRTASEQPSETPSIAPPTLGHHFSQIPVQIQRTPDKPAEPASPSPAPTIDDPNNLDRFGRNQASLTPEHLAKLDKIAWSIEMRLGIAPGQTVEMTLVGHTDTTADEAYNLALGQRRSEAVQTTLQQKLTEKLGEETVKKRVTIVAKSVGEDPQHLAVPTKDRVDEPRNRRVTVSYAFMSAPATEPPKPPLILTPPLPGQPGSPTIPWPPQMPPPLPQPNYRQQLEKAVENDPLLRGVRKLSKPAYDGLLDGLAKADEKIVDQVLDFVPTDDQTKKALKAAAQALLRTLKGEKWTPPTPPLYEMPPSTMPPMPKAPGETIFTLPPWRF